MSIARMGYVGYFKLAPKSGNPIAIRVTNSDLKLSQALDFPDLVDNKVDQTVYQIMPQEVGGSVSFPLIHENYSGFEPNPQKNNTKCQNENYSEQKTFAEKIWELAAQRDKFGRLPTSNIFDVHTRYADNLGYTYNGCLINTLNYDIQKESTVNLTMDIIGGADNPVTLRKELVPGNVDNLNFLSPARVVTWNDAGVFVWGGGEGGNNSADKLLVRDGELTSFTCKIDNQIERIYSLNGKLSPVDIVAKKRKINGTMKMLGAQYELSDYTANNQNRFSSNAAISFGFRLGAAANYYWATGLYGVVFEIETVALSTGLFETETNWTALGDCENNHLATRLGKNVAPDGLGRLPKPTGGAEEDPVYGKSTNNGSSIEYPEFDSFQP